jgi:hypothetical protein
MLPLSSNDGPVCQFAAEILVRSARKRQRALLLLRRRLSGRQRRLGYAGGHYRVRLHGEWIVVPDNAVVTEPNKFGPAVVWPYMGTDGQTQIRCFLPGAGA